MALAVCNNTVSYVNWSFRVGYPPYANPKKLGLPDFENSKFSRQIVAMRNFFEKRSKIISANFSQTKKVRFLGFQKFQVFSPNRGDAKLFQKLVKSNLDNDLRKF